MPKLASLTDVEGTVRELKLDDLKRFGNASVLPQPLQQKLNLRGPQETTTKKSASPIGRRAM